MPILTLIFVGIIYAIIALKEKMEPPTQYPFNAPEKERDLWIMEQNHKRMEDIVRKYGRK